MFSDVMKTFTCIGTVLFLFLYNHCSISLFSSFLLICNQMDENRFEDMSFWSSFCSCVQWF